MSDQHDSPHLTQLKQVNSELSNSLERCRHLVDECRSKLAANANEPAAIDGGQEDDAGSA